ncbi:MAG: hypothetical protein KBC48_02195 [Candidatus Pacebacteria bacterium]|nr:hypothetical protein [Candidatus Paceibacterota bacterium]
MTTKRRFVLVITIMVLLMTPVSINVPYARAADTPLTFNTESMRQVELEAAVRILMGRLIVLLQQRLELMRG